MLDHQSLAAPVELVAFSTEGPPFFGGKEMGSAVHADSLVASEQPLRAMIALETIGYFTPSEPDENRLLSLIYPSRGNFIPVVGRWSERTLVPKTKKAFRGASKLPVVSYTGPVVIGADLSDPRNFWLAGFAAITVADTAFLGNPNYHTGGDRADTLDYDAMARVVDGVFSTVVHLANDARSRDEAGVTPSGPPSFSVWRFCRESGGSRRPSQA